MKRISVLLLALVVLTAAGCGAEGEDEGWWGGLEGDREALEKAAFTGEVNNLEGVSLTLVSADSMGGTFTALNTTDKDIEFGEKFLLHRLVDGYWIPCPDTATWVLTSRVLQKNVETEKEADWSFICDVPLPSGTYRFVMEFMDYRGPGDYTKYTMAAEFEVE